MCEFDEYIHSVTGNLKVDRKKKEELADEFKDHLDSLKSEYMAKGLPEEEAARYAIECFGKADVIQKKLIRSLSGFRNKRNILAGVLITLLIFVLETLVSVPMMGVVMAFSDYSSGTIQFSVFGINGWSIFGWHIVKFISIFILFFIPVGYFIPIVFNRSFKLVPLVAICSIPGILAALVLNITFVRYTHMVNVGDVITCVFGGILGGLAGYALLNAVNKRNLAYSK